MSGPRLLTVAEVVWDTLQAPETPGLNVNVYLSKTRPRRRRHA